MDVYNIENKNLILDKNLLHSFIDFEGKKNNLKFKASLEVCENLNKDKSSRYEYIYPKYRFKKFDEGKSNEFYFKTYGSQRQYETNVYEGILINDILYESEPNYSENGFISNINTLIKNVNVDANNLKNTKINLINLCQPYCNIILNCHYRNLTKILLRN